MTSTTTIIARLDALDAGDVGLFRTSEGSVGAHMPPVEIRTPTVLCSFCGYGETPDEALHALWQLVEDLDGNECILVRGPGDERRYYVWNGASWKPTRRYAEATA